MEKMFLQIKNKEKDILGEGMKFEQELIWLPEVFPIEVFISLRDITVSPRAR